MQEEKVTKALTNIKSELLSAKDRLFLVEASIKCALRELERTLQTIQNLSMQKDIPVCKCQDILSPEEMCTFGEKRKQDYQLIQDPVKIAQDFWESFKSEE